MKLQMLFNKQLKTLKKSKLKRLLQMSATIKVGMMMQQPLNLKDSYSVIAKM